MVHKHYNQLNASDTQALDAAFEEFIVQLRNNGIVHLKMDDTVERVVDAAAKWILESRER